MAIEFFLIFIIIAITITLLSFPARQSEQLGSTRVLMYPATREYGARRPKKQGKITFANTVTQRLYDKTTGAMGPSTTIELVG